VNLRWRILSNCAYSAPNGTSLSFRSIIISAEISLGTGALLYPDKRLSDIEDGGSGGAVFEIRMKKMLK
jgi:hypothetical protein